MFNHIMIAYKRIITNPLRFLELKKHVHDFPGKTFFPPWLPFQRNLWPFRAQGWRTSSAITVMMISEVRPPATGGRDGSDPMEDSVDYKWWISKIISIVKLHSVHLLAWQFSPLAYRHILAQGGRERPWWLRMPEKAAAFAAGHFVRPGTEAGWTGPWLLHW
jgi:hypothetical protein